MGYGTVEPIKIKNFKKQQKERKSYIEMKVKQQIKINFTSKGSGLLDEHSRCRSKVVFVQKIKFSLQVFTGFSTGRDVAFLGGRIRASCSSTSFFQV